MNHRAVTILVTGACLLAQVALAQTGPGTISGTVTDPEGGTFAGAFVGVMNSTTAVIFLDEDNRLGSGISGAHSEFVLLDTSKPFSMIGVAFKRFIEIFRNEVGLTPKLFCRIRRFQRVLGAVDDATEVDWACVALRCGYFDQAHFIHDFRAFSGVNPSTYLRHRTHRNHVAVHG